jgi:hypothetical protein
MNFLEYLNEKGGSSFLVFYNNVSVYYNSYSNHSFKSRLNRSGLKKSEFIEKIKKLIDVSSSYPEGLYGINFNDFGLICKIKHNEIFIITILSKGMKITNTDFNIMINEWIKETFKIDVEMEDNIFKRIKLTENEDVYLEKENNVLEIYSDIFIIEV